MRFAVIPSNGRSCLLDCIDAVQEQVDRIIIIDTSATPPGYARPRTMTVFLDKVHVQEDSGPVNISRWWNKGLAIAEYMAEAEEWANSPSSTWEVAILNDDAIVPDSWFEAVSHNMRYAGSAAGCSGRYNLTQKEPVAVPLDMRMQGYAFMVAGEHSLRANEDLHWYFTDDYIDWESRKLGGMTMTGGYPVEHLFPNGQMTPELHTQTALDAQTFMDIYGRRPW